MQARKRAKPVKFGKAAKEEQEKKVSASSAHEHKEHETHTHHADVVEKAAKDVETAVKENPEPVEESVEVTVEKVEEDHSREDKELAELVHAAAIRKAEALKVSSPSEEEEEESSTKSEERPSERSEKRDEEAAEEKTAEKADEEEREEKETEREREDSERSEEPFSERELEQPKRKTKRNNLVLYFVLVTILTFLIGLGLIAAFNYGLQNKSFNYGRPAIVLSPTTSPSPSPVPTKAVDLSAYNIKVLNGSGVTGAASRVKTSLVTEGFKVSSTANAASSDFTKTKIQAKSTVDKAYLDKLQEFLNKTYVVESSIDTLTAPGDEADVVVTIGTETR